MPNWKLLWDIIRLLKDHYHWYHLSVLQILSLLAMPHTMQYWQSIRPSVGLAVIFQGGKQKKPLYKYTARHIDIAVWENDVKKKVLRIDFTLCHLMSKASILKTAPLYVVWEISFPSLMMEEQFLQKCTSSRPHGIQSQIMVIFTFNNVIALDFLKITEESIIHSAVVDVSRCFNDIKKGITLQNTP